jgi:Carbohydrate-binding family 9
LSTAQAIRGSGPAVQQTVARVCHDAAALYVRFDCEDRNIWGTYTRRDEPIYDEEVVEVFIAPGAQDPVRYLEFEISPNGVLLDARVYNSPSTRADLQVDVEWLCPGIRWAAGRDDAAERWWAGLAVPWAAVAPDAPAPEFCRANFYRIERLRSDAPEYSCWSPTLTDPADFHKPKRFGLLELR